MKIKTSENIFESIVQEKYYYNTHAQTLGEYAEKLDKKWVAVDDVEDILNSRLISLRNMREILVDVKELSSNTLKLRAELQYEIHVVKDYLKELNGEDK